MPSGPHGPGSRCIEPAGTRRQVDAEGSVPQHEAAAQSTQDDHTRTRAICIQCQAAQRATGGDSGFVVIQQHKTSHRGGGGGRLAVVWVQSLTEGGADPPLRTSCVFRALLHMLH